MEGWDYFFVVVFNSSFVLVCFFACNVFVAFF